MVATGPITYAHFDYCQGNYIKRVDYDASFNPIYIGWSQPGTGTSELRWRLVKNTFDASNDFTNSGFPNGSPSFTFSWDSRASYTYS